MGQLTAVLCSHSDTLVCCMGLRALCHAVFVSSKDTLPIQLMGKLTSASPSAAHLDTTSTSDWHPRRRTQQLVEELAVPPPGSQALSFPSEFSRSRIAQYWVILWKNRKVYWRSPGALAEGQV